MAGSRAALDSAPSLSPEATNGKLSSYVQRNLMPEPSAASGAAGSSNAADLTFGNDIYQPSSSSGQASLKALEAANPSNISFTTPGQDKSGNSQPDYYLNAEGKLVANPKATPSKDGKISIEVEGNNSAKQAKQYADHLQKQTISDLVAMYKAANPGAKVPEMWQAILDSSPDDSTPNTGDSQNNNSVTPAEEQAYDGSSTSTPSTTTPTDTSTPSTPTDSTPATTSGGGSDASGGSSGGSSGGGDYSGGSGGSSGGSGGGSDSGSSGVSDSPTPVSNFSDNYSGPADSSAINSIGLKAGQEGANLWSQSPFASVTDNGVEGCAASVSVILKDAGYPSSVMSAGVDTLVSNMESQEGWKQNNTISDAKPGDIIYGDNGGSDQHIGVVVQENGKLYCCDNDSYPSGGGAPHMILEPLSTCYIVEHFGSNAHLVQPPESSSSSSSSASSSDAQPTAGSAQAKTEKTEPKPGSAAEPSSEKTEPKKPATASSSGSDAPATTKKAS